MSAETITIDQLLERIQRDGVRKAVTALRKPPVPSRLLQELADMKSLPEAQAFVAAYPLAPSHLLETLAKASPDAAVLEHLATNPRTPPHLLVAFATHTEASIRAQAAAHPQLPPRELLVLADDPEPAVRRSLAGNDSLRLPQHAMLAADRDPGVRLTLAGHSTLPPQLGLVLGADHSAVVRLQTVATAQADEEMLLGWAASDEENVQLALCQRKELPDKVQRVLFHSPHASVRRILRATLKLDAIDQLHLATRGEPEERFWLAAQVPIARPLQRVLAQDEDFSVRKALAANPSIDDAIVSFYIGQADEATCVALATNPGVTPERIQELAATRQPAVIVALAYRDELDDDLVRLLLRHSNDFRRHWALQKRAVSDLDEDTAKVLLAHTLPAVRMLAVDGYPWSPDALRAMAGDPSPSIRIAVIKHPNASDELVAACQNDSDPAVAAYAKAAQDIRITSRLKAQQEKARAQLHARSNTSAKTAATTDAASPSASKSKVATVPAKRPAAKSKPASDPSLFLKLKRLFWQ
ncbi:MAG: hypothetical protein SFY80_15760 [Verrucomicrobiota bacterium]|nr:hypothetical protein [Verrucomicrobiota bacterium]